jgi:hypothetical protein
MHDRAGGGIFLLGIDDTYGCLRISVEQGDEALHLSLGVADEAGADLIVQGLRLTVKRRCEQCKER